ncbi:hypothetical protein [Dactylosporangium sp. NPDC051484]|uniref:hypothetical protein n=1 Tax=Dactylosporangium sp. NPDC051484 TaxID=3154942 RepID=UPI00344B856A
MPGRMLATYDNAWRQTASIFQSNGVEQWRTTSAHGGDYSDVTAPLGGIGTTGPLRCLIGWRGELALAP